MMRTLPVGVEHEATRGLIGVTPLQQALVSVGGGRVQVLDPAWDTSRSEWFSVFGDERRQPGEWGHWTGRGMSWNAQCAACHTTDFVKGYDPRDDSYRSAWRALGVGCESCHGAIGATHSRHDARWRGSVIGVCASCHARREELTARFAPGERFDDHYRLTLADAPGAYLPDGRASDEDFEYASLAMSAMGQRGVVCVDCHDPHSGALRAPIERDELCLTCHGEGARGAPVIRAEHSHHAARSEGARCVNCHMPAATYMRRDRRRDHGFTAPDPLGARAVGAVDACGECHVGRDAEWSERAIRSWFGEPRRRHERDRTLLVAALSRGDELAVSALCSFVRGEENDAWRASIVAMLAPWSHREDVRSVTRWALRDRAPWVRAAAARAIAMSDGSLRGEVAPLRRDEVRAVRVEAAWAMRDDRRGEREARDDLARFIDVTCDQPAGALRRAELARVEGRAREAEVWRERAMRWDPSLSDASGAARSPR